MPVNTLLWRHEWHFTNFNIGSFKVTSKYTLLCWSLMMGSDSGDTTVAHHFGAETSKT